MRLADLALGGGSIEKAVGDFERLWDGVKLRAMRPLRAVGAHPEQIKSLENISIAYVEEAESVSKESWDVLKKRRITAQKKHRATGAGGTLK